MKEASCSNRIADFIRARSKALELTSLADLEAESHCLDPNNPESIEAVIQDVTSVHEDIKAVTDVDGRRFYYSEGFMTGAYAGVLVLKEEGSLRMMSEVVRQHSRIYPRPVPISLFQDPPFDMNEERIAAGLKEMRGQSRYADIEQLTTSIGSVFLYSKDYLGRSHAAMLAEWIDVGQDENA